jgi:hypothetical protein
MKKILLVILTAAVTLCQAQDSHNKLGIGLKAGYNYSNVYDTRGEEFEADSKLGITAGLFASIPIGRYLGIQPEILFAQRGFRGTGTLLGSSYKFTRTTSYLDLPVLVALKPSRHFTLLAGPQFSYLFKQKDVFTNSAYSVQQEEEFKNDNVRKNMMCLLVGVDLNLDPVIIGLRSGWDLRKNNGDGTSTTPRYKNMWLQATFGFRF